MGADQSLCDMDAQSLAYAFAEKAISPVEAAEAVFARIERLDAVVNAFVHLDRAGAMAAAHASEKRWAQGEPLSPIDGIPTSIKELTAVAGWPLRRCSRAYEEISREDAPAASALREAGAVLIGKTNSPEFGWKGVTDNALFGATANPYDPSKTAGGSSGGAAAAAALGFGCLHVGTDGGGSIRIPASFCGVVGLKPSLGRVPVYPLSRFGTTSHVGPITRTARDAALMLDIMARPDARDPYSPPVWPTPYAEEAQKGVAGLRIAYCGDLGGHKSDPEIAALTRAMAMKLADLGARVEEISSPIADCSDLFRKIWATGIALTMRAFPKDARAMMEPAMVALGEWGEQVDHMDYSECEYARGVLASQLSAFHQDFDLLLTPTEPCAAFSLEKQVTHEGQRDWIDWTPYTYPFNLTGQPAASIPCGYAKDGLPAGLQIIGPRTRDDLVLRAAQACEGLVPRRLPGLLLHDSIDAA